MPIHINYNFDKHTFFSLHKLYFFDNRGGVAHTLPGKSPYRNKTLGNKWKHSKSRAFRSSSYI